MSQLRQGRGGLESSTRNSGHQQQCLRQDGRQGCDKDQALTNSFESSSEDNSSGGTPKGLWEGVSEVVLDRWECVGSYKGRRIPANDLYEKGLDVRMSKCSLVRL